MSLFVFDLIVWYKNEAELEEKTSVHQFISSSSLLAALSEISPSASST